MKRGFIMTSIAFKTLLVFTGLFFLSVPNQSLARIANETLGSGDANKNLPDEGVYVGDKNYELRPFGGQLACFSVTGVLQTSKAPCRAKKNASEPKGDDLARRQLAILTREKALEICQKLRGASGNYKPENDMEFLKVQSCKRLGL